IREGAAKPKLGWLIGANGSVNDPELWPKQDALKLQALSWTDPNAGEALANAQLPPLFGLRNLAAMLSADAMLARETGDGKRLFQDIDSTLNLSRQVGENASLLLNLISLSISEMAMDQMEQTLRERPTLLPKQDWIALAKRLSVPKVASDVISIESERM